jgi:dolichyl-phosphate-mannose--protein O-mannosyl transferase
MDLLEYLFYFLPLLFIGSLCLGIVWLARTGHDREQSQRGCGYILTLAMIVLVAFGLLVSYIDD